MSRSGLFLQKNTLPEPTPSDILGKFSKLHDETSLSGEAATSVFSVVDFLQPAPSSTSNVTSAFCDSEPLLSTLRVQTEARSTLDVLSFAAILLSVVCLVLWLWTADGKAVLKLRLSSRRNISSSGVVSNILLWHCASIWNKKSISYPAVNAQSPMKVMLILGGGAGGGGEQESSKHLSKTKSLIYSSESELTILYMMPFCSASSFTFSRCPLQTPTPQWWKHL